MTYQVHIIDVKNQHVYHGGNFHGDYISLEMDKLKIVITKLTMLAERQLNYLLNMLLIYHFSLAPPCLNIAYNKPDSGATKAAVHNMIPIFID